MCETMVSRSFPDANCQTSITMIIMNIVLQSGLKKKKSSVENARHLGAPLPCHLLLCAAGAGAALVSSKKKKRTVENTCHTSAPLPCHLLRCAGGVLRLGLQTRYVAQRTPSPPTENCASTLP